MDEAFAVARPDTAEPAGRPAVPGAAASVLEPPVADLPAGFWRGPSNPAEESTTSGAQLEGATCPHCREQAALALPGGKGWCAACGGLVSTAGEAEVICRSCALPHAAPLARNHACVGEAEHRAGGDADGPEQGARLLKLLRERLRAESFPAAGLYVNALRAVSTRGGGSEVLFAPSPEPLVLTLPDRTLVLSSGAISALEDEAQLAFILAREESLVRQGCVARRFRAGVPAAFWSIWRRREAASLERAIESSCLVGFGTEAETQADGYGLAALVAADYDPQAGARALARLDHASRGTSRFRLSRVRSRLLARALADAGRPAVARLNREVYRRAVAPVVLGWNGPVQRLGEVPPPPPPPLRLPPLAELPPPPPERGAGALRGALPPERGELDGGCDLPPEPPRDPAAGA